MRVARLSGFAGAILILAAACGGGGGPAATAGGQPTPAGCSGSGGTAVNIADFTFSPTPQTVAVGGEVTWTNNDTTTHTVTFDGGPDCGRLAPGASVSRTFDTAGSFTYHCSIHATMQGKIEVS